MGKVKMYLKLVFILSLSLFAFAAAAFNYNSNKGLLSDVKVITLHHGKMTNARRSSPVPQLKCVGGSAQHKFQPKTVQCINQGSDGYDIQWECKTDMDNSYRFGHVEVTCEGYDYPNDPYVLKGSCGLEYSIDFTEEGLRKEHGHSGNSYSYKSSYGASQGHEHEGGLGGLLVFGGIALAIFIVYSKCLAPQVREAQRQQGQNNAGDGGSGHTNPTAPPPQPPPYGFKPEFTPGGSPPPFAPPSYESSTGYRSNPAYDTPHASTSSNQNQRQDNSGPGFWSGAAAGGLMGYLFGGQNRGGGYNNYHTGGWGNTRRHNYHSPGSSWGFGSASHTSSSRGSSPTSSGSRTTSGFGGTSRR